MASVCLAPATPERAVHGEGHKEHKLHPGAEAQPSTTHDEDHGPVSPPESPLKPLTDTRPGPEKTREVVQLTLAQCEADSFPGARATRFCAVHAFTGFARLTFFRPPANLAPAQTRSSSASSRRAASGRPTARGPT